MALFRKSISQSELGSGQSDADRARHATTYSAEAGGWVKAEEKPVAGTGTTDKDSSGARLWGRR